MLIEFKSTVVRLILDKQTEKALELLAGNFQVSIPTLKIGLPKGHHKTAYGCYTNQNETISLLDSDILGNPFVILHEFYHHLRSKGVDRQHKGTEKNADKFAIDFIREYEVTLNNMRASQ
jgi:hypothetical protein